MATLWPERARALASCGKAAVEVACRGCGDAQLVPYRCGARSCPTCARITAAIYAAKVANRARWTMENRGGLTEAGVEPIYGPLRLEQSPRGMRWRFLTLTTRAPAVESRRFMPRYARAQVLHTRGAFGKFWRSTPWGKIVRLKLWRPEHVTKYGEWKEAGWQRTTRARRDTAFVMGEETAPGGMVHIHVAVFGEYVHWSLLKVLWNRALGHKGKINPDDKRASLPGDVKIRRLKGDSPAQLDQSLREVLKYATKGEGRSASERATRAALIEYAYRGVRRVEFGGFLRQMPELTRAELATAHATAKPCETAECPAPAPGESRFYWLQMHGVGVTAANGGFGPLKIDPRIVAHDGTFWLDFLDPPPWHDEYPDASDILADDLTPDPEQLEREINELRERDGLPAMSADDWREYFNTQFLRTA